MVNHFARKRYWFKGMAQVPEEGVDFERHVVYFSYRGLLDAPRRTRAIVIVQVNQVRPLISQSYDILAGEASMRNTGSGTTLVSEGCA